MANFTQLFLDKITSKSEQMTNKFQELAERSGWDPKLYGGVSINAGGFQIPDEIKSDVQDSEYGFPGQPPRAAMRKFKPTMQKDMGAIANEAALEVLSSEKGLFN